MTPRDRELNPAVEGDRDAPDQHPILGRRPSRRRLIALDAAAVLAYTALLLLAGPAGSAPAQAARVWEPLVLLALATAPLTVRRIWPLSVFVTVTVVSAAGVVRDLLWDPLLPAAFALYAVALTRPLVRWWERWLPGLAIALLAAAGALSPVRAQEPYWWVGGPGLLLLGFSVLLASWELARATRERRAYAVRTAEQFAQRAVTEERLRLARELHDVVTHSMGLIAVKAGVANHVVRTRPQEAHDALRIIENTSRSALDDLRRMLGVLRSDTDGARLPPAVLGPAPGPHALPELARRSGAELVLRGTSRLPDGVGLAVYRIVQEALTNVGKHAGPQAHCQVVVAADQHRVRVEVTNDGPPAPVEPTTGGHGLIGMRERAAMYGGTFTAGPRPEGGFRVTADLPYQEER